MLNNIGHLMDEICNIFLTQFVPDFRRFIIDFLNDAYEKIGIR